MRAHEFITEGKKEFSPQFKAWFGNSKVVDTSGNPLVVYHSTDSGDIVDFDPALDKRGNGLIFFAPDPWDTLGDASTPSSVTYPCYLLIQNLFDATKNLSPRLVEWINTHKQILEKDITAYYNEFGLGYGQSYFDEETSTLNIRSYIFAISSGDWQAVEASKSLINAIKSMGYDGFKFFESGDTYAVFSPAQIKSVVGNNGNYNKDSASIIDEHTK